jgi:hypothetical protein
MNQETIAKELQLSVNVSRDGLSKETKKIIKQILNQ